MQLLEDLIGISQYSRVNEPGIVKYGICLPANAQDQTSIVVIEE